MNILNTSQKQVFKEQGIIKLEKYLSLEYVSNIQMLVHKEFEKEGFYIDNNWLQENVSMTSIRKVFKKFKNIACISNFLLEDKIKKVICELLNEEDVVSMSKSTGILFTLPNAKKWQVPYDSWHVDIPRLAYEGEYGIQVFSFIESIKPHCGGTLAIKGSHRLFNTNKLSSKQLKTKLKQFSYFKN